MSSIIIYNVFFQPSLYFLPVFTNLMPLIMLWWSFHISSNYKKTTKWILPFPCIILILFKFTQFSFTLLSNRSYLIWFHDPDFFLPSINPDIIPQTHIRIEDKPKVIWVYLRPVYYEILSKSGEIKKENQTWSQLESTDLEGGAPKRVPRVPFQIIFGNPLH